MAEYGINYSRGTLYDAPVQQYPSTIAEDLSIKYKNLIDAERKHFIMVEGEYNSFIYQLDQLYKQLQDRFEVANKENQQLTNDNQELAHRLKKLQLEDQDRSATLKNLYFICNKQAKKIADFEKENYDLHSHVNSRHEKNVETHYELKSAIAQKNLLDERLSDVEGKLSTEISRLRRIIDDRDTYIAECEKKVDDYANQNLKVTDSNRQLTLELEGQKVSLEGRIHQQSLEIEHLRRLIDEERARSRAYQNFSDAQTGVDQSLRLKDLAKVLQLPDAKFFEEEVKRLRKENETAQETIKKLRSSPPETRVDYQDINIHAEPLNDLVERVERALVMNKRNATDHMRKTFAFALWKAHHEIGMVHLENDDLQQENQQLRRREPPKNHPDFTDLIEKLTDVYLFVRGNVVDIIFEVFVRSANHAYKKKTNSFILFIINIGELKKDSGHIISMYIQTYEKLKEIVEINKPKDPMRDTVNTLAALQKAVKGMNEDIGHRDNINTWIEDTIEQVDKKRSITNENNESNKEYLYLFRLLNIKYRCTYPMTGKALNLDPDLQISMEDKICRSFLRALDIADVEQGER